MKPILFNTAMVQAILDGRKTVTRRVIKPQPRYPLRRHNGGWHEYSDDPLCDPICHSPWGYQYSAPYQPGDILWVRETWICMPPDHEGKEWGIAYAADGMQRYVEMPDSFRPMLYGPERWRPSSHMPREAARIFLRATEVGVERLQDITEGECMAEGVRAWTKDGRQYKYYTADREGDFPDCEWSKCPRAPREAFSQIWDSTIPKKDLPLYGWDANPWVWVIEFERCERPEAEP